jgi:hypothetical protein
MTIKIGDTYIDRIYRGFLTNFKEREDGPVFKYFQNSILVYKERGEDIWKSKTDFLYYNELGPPCASDVKNSYLFGCKSYDGIIKFINNLIAEYKKEGLHIRVVAKIKSSDPKKIMKVLSSMGGVWEAQADIKDQKKSRDELNWKQITDETKN